MNQMDRILCFGTWQQFVFVLFLFISVTAVGAEKDWKAKWITSPDAKNEANTWICFRKDVSLQKVPKQALAAIAADSKYWLWINGQLVVFEGSLKRGPSPEDTYYDEVNLAPYLKKGTNKIAVLLWYFGKDGFSHKSSGKAGLLFDLQSDACSILSDGSWQTMIHPSILPWDGIQPNMRLSESSLYFDGRKEPVGWNQETDNSGSWVSAPEMGTPPCQPWNNLELRPIPMWKDYGLKDYVNHSDIPSVSTGEPIVCKLPSNLQVTPWLKVQSKSGEIIEIQTDHLNGGGEPNVMAKYITRDGLQEYESLGWMNGEKVTYSIPQGVKIIGLKYRETGYNTEFTGSFRCSDDFFNQLWNKARRTLYVTMRDNYMDCPDRERAQWWGDEVIEGGEAFYAFDPQGRLLHRKGMYELIKWQKPDGVLFSPVPAGNWDKELPDQMLASIGYYGFWNYYMQTGDKQVIADLYEGVVRYMSVWKLNDRNTLVYRGGGWDWADWGEHIDMELIQNAWYYLALKGTANMAKCLGKKEDATNWSRKMEVFKTAFDKTFWNGKEYRSAAYLGKTDDRGQALAVVAGLADEAKYPLLFDILKAHEHASPYMEKYVIEALFKMGQDVYGLERMKKRFSPMVHDTENSTLWEVWGQGVDGFLGGTTNHAWSGGGLTILSQLVCGISPLEPGYSKFQVAPQTGGLTFATARVGSVRGMIETRFTDSSENFELEVTVPEATSALVKLPRKNLTSIYSGGQLIWRDGLWLKKGFEKRVVFSEVAAQLEVSAGKWMFKTR